MERNHPSPILIILSIAYQALFEAPQRENLIGGRVVPEQAFRIATDIFRKFGVTRELSEKSFGLDDTPRSFMWKGQCGYLLIQLFQSKRPEGQVARLPSTWPKIRRGGPWVFNPTISSFPSSCLCRPDQNLQKQMADHHRTCH